MTTATQFTQEQVRSNFNEAQKQLLPAKFKNSLADRTVIEQLVTQHMLAKQLEPTADNFYSAFKALFTVLPWEVKPAKLVLIEKNAAPATTESSVKLNEQRAKTVKSQEIADAYAKEQAEYEQTTYTLIDSFLPYNKRGSIDYRKRDEVQALLKKHVATEKARNVRMKDVHAAVAEHIRKEYDAIDRATERL